MNSSDFATRIGSNVTTETVQNVTQSDRLSILVNPLDPEVKKAINIMLILVMAVIMMALGCGIEVAELKRQLRRPVGVVIGMVCQFILYPPLTFGLAHGLKLQKWDAIGMILLGTCPGGAISNIMTYWAGGNVALSVSMTAASTAIGIGMMPLNLFIYSRSWTDNTAVVPYKNIVIALVCILIPVSIGMIIRRKFPKQADWIIKAGSVLGMLIIIGVIILSCIQYPAMWTSPWRVWVGGAFLPAMGLVLGYTVAFIARLPEDCRRTVAIEISAQNVALCLTLIVISFPRETFLLIILYPTIFGLFSATDLFLFVCLCRSADLCMFYRRKLKGERLESNPHIANTFVPNDSNINKLDSAL